MGFVFNAKQIFLTYKSQIDKKSLREFFCDSDRVEIAHEIGETGYEHTHVYVHYPYQKKIQDEHHWDYGEIHPNIRTVGKTKKDKNKVLDYLAKSDSECGHLAIDDVQKIQSFSNVNEAMSEYKDEISITKPRDVIDIFNCKNNNRRLKYMINEFRDWQKRLFDELMKEPDDRKIIWYVDEKGGMGKSAFCKYMKLNHNAIYCKACPGTHHFNEVIRNEVATTDSNIVLLDLQRLHQDREGIYPCLEELKDGIITCSKYSGENLVVGECHVVVMANQHPWKEALSMDRWSIRVL